ncbi:MAG: hypothetical protein AB7T49_04210 [Oligoflexales bacterium]
MTKKNQAHIFGILAVLALTCVGCKSRENRGSGVKYITAAGDEEDKYLLIHYVHDKFLVWDYGGPKDCANSKNITDEFVNDRISEWLNALSQAGKDGKVNLESPIIATPVNYNKFADESATTIPRHLYVKFVCGNERSNYVRSKKLVTMYPNMASKVDDSLPPGLGETVEQFLPNTMLHELGHAFGLADVYIEGDFDKAKGHQPVSVMSGGLDGNKSLKKINLTEDDIAGLIHLYNHYVLRTEELTTCPVGYVKDENPNGYRYDEQTRGCIRSDAPVL